MSTNIVIIDYGMGNLHSVYKKLRRLKAEPSISADPLVIERADKIVLPGVGHFNIAMNNMKKLGLIDVLNEMVLVKRKPILGICLGMQLMADRSEEGNAVGFGWIPGEVTRFQVEDKLVYKVPHMGWNQIKKLKESVLMRNIPSDSSFYFVHSYHYKVNNDEDALNSTEYNKKFISAVEKNNIYGVQYHPEKSHDVGELLLKNFIDL